MTEQNKTSSSKARIKVSKNGPYLVSGKVPLTEKIITCDAEGIPSKWSESKKYPMQENYTLCRCGQSGHKPFCDGTHVKMKFEGTETASGRSSMEQARKIAGPTLELNDVEVLCASARFCHRGGEIWDMVPKSDDPKARKTAIDDAGDCPSGRLVLHERKTGEAIEPSFEQSIVLVEDPRAGVSGPIWVRGGIPIESAEDKVYEVRNRVTLCRCGKSLNKPFCDSSHYPE